MRFFRLAALVGLVLALAGCPPPGPTNIPNPLYERPLPCRVPVPSPATVSSRIGPDAADSLVLAGHVFRVPQGAVREPVNFSMTLLEGDILRLDIRANDRDSFDFQPGVPATLRLSYRECPQQPANPQELRIYRLDPTGRVLVRRFEVELNPQQQWVDAQLPSLSGYTIGTLSQPDQQRPTGTTRP
jgi:hypothetical protein